MSEKPWQRIARLGSSVRDEFKKMTLPKSSANGSSESESTNTFLNRMGAAANKAYEQTLKQNKEKNPEDQERPGMKPGRSGSSFTITIGPMKLGALMKFCAAFDKNLQANLNPQNAVNQSNQQNKTQAAANPSATPPTQVSRLKNPFQITPPKPTPDRS